MAAFGPEMILRELVSWLTLLIIIGGVVTALIYIRLSPWMFLVVSGLGGIVFTYVISRLFMMFGAQLNAGQNIQVVFFISSLISLFSWIALVGGLLAVFRDVSTQLKFLEERQRDGTR